jgi:hypothetical protein
MKPSLLLLLCTLAACSSVSSASWQEPWDDPDRPTRVSLLVGQRNFDEDDYEPVDEQVMAGIEFVHEARESVIGWEFGLAGSATEEDDVLFGADVEAKTGEIYAGIRKSIGTGMVRPYIGGGIAYIHSELELSGPMVSESVDDGSFAGYAHVGVSLGLTSAFFVGVDARLLFASDLDYEDFDSDADYVQLALTIGGAF